MIYGNLALKLEKDFNPPYGKSWKTDAEKMANGEDEKKKKKEILDTRFNTYLPGGENLSMIPRFSDGQLLFLLNNVSKMNLNYSYFLQIK